MVPWLKRTAHEYVGGGVKCMGAHGAHELVLEIQGKSSQCFFSTEKTSLSIQARLWVV